MVNWGYNKQSLYTKMAKFKSEVYNERNVSDLSVSIPLCLVNVLVY
jgi:hypothetical protein